MAEGSQSTEKLSEKGRERRNFLTGKWSGLKTPESLSSQNQGEKPNKDVGIGVGVQGNQIKTGEGITRREFITGRFSTPETPESPK